MIQLKSFSVAENGKCTLIDKGWETLLIFNNSHRAVVGYYRPASILDVHKSLPKRYRNQFWAVHVHSASFDVFLQAQFFLRPNFCSSPQALFFLLPMLFFLWSRSRQKIQKLDSENTVPRNWFFFWKTCGRIHKFNLRLHFSKLNEFRQNSIAFFIRISKRLLETRICFFLKSLA